MGDVTERAPRWSRMESIDGDLFVPREEARVKLAVLEAEVERLREAIKDALHWHVYSVPVTDDDGNLDRIVKVEGILREALDG